MKKTIFLLIIAVLIISGLYVVNSQRDDSISKVKPSSTQIEGKNTVQEVGLPAKVSIPSIDVSSEVEFVGLDEKKNMDVPKDAANIGWYNLGPKPGEMGSAVMAGHLDDPNGDPAVFWDLKKLEAGDKIKVTDESGVTQTFEVTRVETYPFDEFPLKEVFADSSGIYLNLITCEGSFDKATKNYSERTVVYSELAI